MSVVDKSFFEAFGKRITTLRKAQGVTQVQVAELLGVSQQQMHSFEKGTRRIPLCYIPQLADLFAMSTDELLEYKLPPPKPRKRGPVSRLDKQLQQIKALPRSRQRLVSEVLDSLIREAG